jgi:hypothetical protein
MIQGEFMSTELNENGFQIAVENERLANQYEQDTFDALYKSAFNTGYICGHSDAVIERAKATGEEYDRIGRKALEPHKAAA